MRHRHRARFTVVGNDLLQHPTLSALAIGLGAHIQSLPDGADVSVKRLTLRFREGEISIRRALNELAAEGYLERRRVALGGGRFATRLIWYDKPMAVVLEAAAPEAAAHEPGDEPEPEPVHAPEPVRPEAPAPAAPPSGPAAAVLARLRAVDSRLVLSREDVEWLAPAVDEWLGLGIGGAQIARSLTAGLPPAHVPIHHPANFLAYRLATKLPPPLPDEGPPAGTPPLVSCDGCERAVRTYAEHPLCEECRDAA